MYPLSLARRRISTDSRSGSRREVRHDHRPKRLGLRGTPDCPPGPFRVVGDVRDVRFTFDATHGSYGHPDESCHVLLLVSRLSQDLYRVPREHIDHPFPRCLVQRVCEPKGSAQSGQNFRKDAVRICGTRRRMANARWVLFCNPLVVLAVQERRAHPRPRSSADHGLIERTRRPAEVTLPQPFFPFPNL